MTAVLTSELCRVRPPAEPVPKALVGSPAGEIFGALVRMNDGAAHLRLKPGVSASLAMLDPAAVGRHARRHAAALAAAGVAAVMNRLPAYVVASLLGVADDRLEATAGWTAALARCFAPGATAEALEAGKGAADELRRLIGSPAAAPAALVANRVGFLFQAHDATAGLIGNTLVALGRHPEARADLGASVAEVVRFDPPVQNTRRFLAADGVVAGQPMKAGDTILVVLAAANHDPAANASPERFDPRRRERTAFTFGRGPHACPGEAIATAIATAGVEALLAAGVDPASLTRDVRYRPSANVRIPVLPAR
ncbi:MAG TPA: cytochrome P450 [Methylomirabilota bacterium]|nr:cytochrome P450 [Methylomirabilota bacterium]